MKGVGEPPVIFSAAAIANAVFDATGVQIKQTPLTPERVYRAVKSAHE
jgi:CO/xanthine dehydrogenase Mo-binding subunit